MKKGHKTIRWSADDVAAWKEKIPALDIVAEAATLQVEPHTLWLRFKRHGIEITPEQEKLAKRVRYRKHNANRPPRPRVAPKQTKKADTVDVDKILRENGNKASLLLLSKMVKKSRDFVKKRLAELGMNDKSRKEKPSGKAVIREWRQQAMRSPHKQSAQKMKIKDFTGCKYRQIDRKTWVVVKA